MAVRSPDPLNMHAHVLNLARDQHLPSNTHPEDRPEVDMEVLNTAAVLENGVWRVDVKAWLFRKDGSQRRALATLSRLGSLVGSATRSTADALAKKQRFREERAKPVVRAVRTAIFGGLRGQQLEVRFCGQDTCCEWKPVPKNTGRQGRVFSQVEIGDEEVAQLSRGERRLQMEVKYTSPEQGIRVSTATVYFNELDGITVVSDVDDTVKVTQVYRGVMGAMHRSFFNDLEAVQGMPETYRDWADGLLNPSFHFVSNSPGILRATLEEFLRKFKFPQFVLHMRSASEITCSDFKVRKINKLMKEFPRRRFILVGDSGEKDAKTYAEVCRTHSDRVVKIFIRKVDDKFPVDDNVFAGIDPALWQVFTDPAEMVVPDWAYASIRL